MGEITKADSPPSKSVHYLGSVHPNAKAKLTHVSISVMTDERTWLRESKIGVAQSSVMSQTRDMM